MRSLAYILYIFNLNGYEKYLDKNNLNIGACSTSSSTLYMLLILGILLRHDCVCLCMLLHFSNAWHKGDKKKREKKRYSQLCPSSEQLEPLPPFKKIVDTLKQLTFSFWFWPLDWDKEYFKNTHAILQWKVYPTGHIIQGVALNLCDSNIDDTVKQSFPWKWENIRTKPMCLLRLP